MLRTVTLTTFLGFALISTSHAIAAVPVEFSGGNGAPISITLPYPVSFTTFDATSAFGFAFMIQGTPDPFGNTFPTLTGDITYSVDGGGPEPLIYANSGQFVNAIMGDIYFLGNEITYPTGLSVVLSAGTLTTTSNFGAAPPVSGSYEIFILRDNGSFISGPGVAVPEPAGLGLLAVAAALGMRRRAR
jgi:MYXO-CTERM domain-containing protein